MLTTLDIDVDSKWNGSLTRQILQALRWGSANKQLKSKIIERASQVISLSTTPAALTSAYRELQTKWSR